MLAKVITVLSGKGGVGKSTFCANIGKALSKNKKVLLIDGDIGLRSLDMLLGVDSMVVFDWSDVICNRCDREKARLFASDNLHLLASPVSLSKDFTKENFENLILLYKDSYDYILIDSPAGLGEYTEIYFSVSDENIIIATPDDISLRAAYITGEKLSKAGMPDSKMRLVLNKVDTRLMKKGRQRNLDDAIDKTYLRLLGVIPEDKALATCISSKDSAVSEDTNTAFFNITGRILGKDVKLYL